MNIEINQYNFDNKWNVIPKFNSENFVAEESAGYISYKLEKIKKGSIKESHAYQTDVKSTAILIKGEILFQFKNNEKDYLLKKPGETLIYDPNTDHITTAIKNTVLLSIREAN